MKAAKKVITNTAWLYLQLVVGTIAALISIRMVLGALGEIDYGIYMLIAGITGMLGILNSNMVNTSMRFMAHSLGTGDKDIILKTFNTSLFINLLIGIGVIFLMQAGGWLMFEFLVNIPADRMFQARVVFQFMVISAFVVVLFSPFDAVLNAHENIFALAVIEVFSHILKLGIAIYISQIKGDNLLILFGLLTLFVHLLTRGLVVWYCTIKHPEYKVGFKKYVNLNTLSTIVSFSGWNFFGSMAFLAKVQIRGVLFNMFFGVVVNAAEGISRNITNQLNTVAVNLSRAINPQLIKSEGGGHRIRMLQITELSAKFTTFLFAVLAIPLLFEINYVLDLWLKDVPAFTAVFCQWLIIIMLIEKLTFPITDAIRAVGNIRNFQVTETCLALLIIPASYAAFSAGFDPTASFVLALLLAFITAVGRLYFGKKLCGLNVKQYIMNVAGRLLIPISISALCLAVLQSLMQQGLLRLLVVSAFFLAMFTASFWVFSLNKVEKNLIITLAGDIWLKLDRIRGKIGGKRLTL
ncbi:MAG TPA: hypothetical protein VLH61_07260 [Bacteroidales bacterium]|nr:hypothetical protein [Bacteroidales bacterium]